MSRKVIEIVQVLVDRIHQGGYTQRALEDDIYAESQKRIAAEKDRDHWKQARQEAHEAGELMQAEIETPRQRLADAEHPPAMAQQRDEIAYLRARLDEERSVSARLRQQLDATRAEVETLREQLADAQLAVSDAFAEVNSVRQQLDAAQAAVTLQRAGIERLQAFVSKVRAVIDNDCDGQEIDEMIKALAELDAGTTEPTPVAEPVPCPECERLRAELETANEHRTDLVLFVDRVRQSFRVWGGDQSFFDSVSHALDQLDAGTTEPTPVAEPLDAEGEQ